jgi:transposase
MDTSTVAAAVDTMGRQVARHQFRTVEEKAHIVAGIGTPGISVAEVARRHEVNANQVFAWRRPADQGLLRPSGSDKEVKLLPVKVSGEREGRVREGRPLSSSDRAGSEGRIEITLADGVRVVVCGPVTGERTAQLLAALRR